VNDKAGKKALSVPDFRRCDIHCVSLS
jgi:hypothetical protein